jgi:Flp pilus assembly protein TadG
MKHKLSSYLKCQSGNIAIMTAVLMPLVIAGAGFGFETSYWYFKDGQMQQAADKAAYTAALEKRSSASASTMTSAALASATQNGYSPGTLTVTSPPSSGTFAGNSSAVQVVITKQLPKFFVGMFTNQQVTVTARSVARLVTGSEACVLALDAAEDEAVYINGNATLSLGGCSIMSNSTHANSLRITGNSDVTANCIIAAGGVSMNSNTEMTGCAAAQTNAQQANDPFANLAYPPTGSNRTVPNGNGVKNLQPGSYAGMDLNGGTVNMAPGVYYIRSGEFKINGNITVNGTGVTIFMAAGTGGISINGNATVNLAAPTTGTYSGMLMFAHRTNENDLSFNGNVAARLTGAIYAKTGDVVFNGNLANAASCTQVVAGTVEWNGNGSISGDCAAQGMADIPVSQLIALVE